MNAVGRLRGFSSITFGVLSWRMGYGVRATLSRWGSTTMRPAAQEIAITRPFAYVSPPQGRAHSGAIAPVVPVRPRCAGRADFGG